MRISGCVMVKNEEKNIKRCIDSFKNIVHEIIVVDTGSTDRTVEIAEECGAKVYYYKWNDDFASARNVALDNASGDWIIYMDADEYFYNATAKNIPLLLKRVRTDVDSLLCELVNIDNSDKKEKSTAHVIRIFRHKPRIRFNYKIHEVVMNNGKKMRCANVSRDSLLIYHTGYSSEIVLNKFKRNLAILKEEEKSPNCRDMTYFYLGDCYFPLKEYEKAIEYMKKYISTGHVNMGSNMKPYSVVIQSMIRLGCKYEDIMQEIDTAVEKFPGHPLLYNHKADVEYFNNKFDSALKLYHKTLKLQDVYDDVETNFVEGNLFDIYYKMGYIYECKNECDNALEYYLKSLKGKKDYIPPFERLMRIIRSENAEDIIFLLKSVYDDNEESDVAFLVRELMKLKVGKVLMYYTNIWLKKFHKEDSSIVFTFLCNKNYEEAYKYFSKLYFEDWSYVYALFSVISSVMSKNNKNIDEIIDFVKPSFRRFMMCYTGRKDVGFIPDDKHDYLRILTEFLLLDLKEEAHKILDMRGKFDIDAYDSIGNILMDCRNYKYAAEIYKECLDYGDIYDEGYICNKIGIAYFRLYDYENAFIYIEKAIASGYENNLNFEYLRWIYEKSNNDLMKVKIKKITEKNILLNSTLGGDL
ncbi:glycosyltransferase family 2 protein [Clostridium luticellarii]|uniref:SPBc2 prophage-derived glycosyltransferase SunS n=1 Tax=Clostridium luticellarii TaxID=1691940 RepID=A0A2T0BMY8_9CLOT|nr:glycosyltransferase family 2 protein [Clostridium luticellarii]PRR85250.1 SPBc2 prophage-derived glycosyltransferase SunS [Clostridium luticellarii]